MQYLDNTPFLVPIPKKLSALIKTPIKALLKKNRPENGKEITFIMAVYVMIFVLLSIPLVLFFSM